MNKEGFTGKIGGLYQLYDDKNMPLYSKMTFSKLLLFEYQSIEPNLTYIDKNNVQYQIDYHFYTDGGSIPSICQIIPGFRLSPFDFLRSYLYHDCAYIYGGLYIKYLTDDIFKFRLLNRKQVDSLLCSTLTFDGAKKREREVIYHAVNTFSRFTWDDGKKPIDQKKQRKINKINVYDSEGNIIEENNI